MLVVLFCLITNCLFGQDVLSKDSLNALFDSTDNLISKKEQSFFAERGASVANRFEYKIDRRQLPKLEPISPGQQPGWSYFWNFMDGSFLITTESEGRIFHNYDTDTENYDARIEITPIKTPEEDEEEEKRILLSVEQETISEPNSNRLIPNKNEQTAKITNGKSVELLNTRSAVPGHPLTIVLSLLNDCNKQSTFSTINFSVKSKYIFYVDSLEDYYKDKIEQEVKPMDDEVMFNANLPNIKRNEQRNYLANFRIDPNVPIGEEIVFNILYTNGCDTYEDELILETAKSHDPSFKLMTLSDTNKNCEELAVNYLDMFIHFENDGEGTTETISIVDSIVPPMKINSVECFQTKNLLYHNIDELVTSDSCLVDNDTIWKKPITTILHTPDTGCLILTKDINSTFLYNDTITLAFDSIMLKGKKNADYLTKFPPIETMDEVKFRVQANGIYTSPFFCNIADIYFDDNEAETVIDCIFNSCVCDTLVRVKNSILKGSCTINLGEDTILKPDYSKLDFTPDKYIWWPDEQTTDTIKVSPKKDKLYMVVASHCDNETGIEKYVIGRKIVYVNRGKITPVKIDTVVQHVSCYDSLDGSFNLKIEPNENYKLKWRDLRDTMSFAGSATRDTMANGTYYYTIYNSKQEIYTDSVTINEPPPLFFEYIINKASNDPISLYNIESIVYGGVPDYEIKWEWQNEIRENTYNLNNVGAGEYLVTIKDTTKWERKYIINIPDCDVIDPGIIPDDMIEVCAGQPSEVAAENVVTIDDFEHFYVLHRGDLNEVIDFNENGEFTNNGNYQRNEELFVSSIVVPADENNEPDLDYFCVSIDLKSTPIVFYEPIQINSNVFCRKETCTFEVGFSITGGAADYEPNNERYTIGGIYNGLVASQERVFVSDIPDGSNYQIIVLDDGSGWGDLFISEPIQCKKLPIELLYFKGEAKKEGNLLEWATASEIENDYFTIYQSFDGIEFKELHQVNGLMTSSTQKKYDYLHTNPKDKLTYYKLTQTDVDGSKNNLGYVAIERDELRILKFSIYPNPASNYIQLTFDDEIAYEKFSIFNNQGERFYKSRNTSQNSSSIDISKWPKGVYLVQLKYADKTITEKFIKY